MEHITPLQGSGRGATGTQGGASLCPGLDYLSPLGSTTSAPEDPPGLLESIGYPCSRLALVFNRSLRNTVNCAAMVRHSGFGLLVIHFSYNTYLRLSLTLPT